MVPALKHENREILVMLLFFHRYFGSTVLTNTNLTNNLNLTAIILNIVSVCEHLLRNGCIKYAARESRFQLSPAAQASSEVLNTSSQHRKPLGSSFGPQSAGNMLL